MSRNPDAAALFEASKKKLAESMARFEEQLIREGVLKPGEHLTLNEMADLGWKRKREAMGPQKNTTGLWLSSGDFIPPEKVHDYLDKFIGIEPRSARDEAVRSWLADTKGTLFNPQSAATGSVSAGTQTDPCVTEKKLL